MRFFPFCLKRDNNNYNSSLVIIEMGNKKFNIAIEAFALSLEHVTGVGMVALHYIRELQKIDKSNNYFIYTIEDLKHPVATNNNWFHVQYINKLKKLTFILRDIILDFRDGNYLEVAVSYFLRIIKMAIELINRAWFPIWLYLSFKKNEINCYFGTSAEFFPRFFPQHVKKIWLIHDLVWKFVPETINERSLFMECRIKNRMKRADTLCAVSENTAKDVRDLLGNNSNIIILHNAADKEIFYRANSKEIQRVKIKYDIKKPYILSVGTLEPRKNIMTLIRAYERMYKVNSYFLVLVGDKGWKNKDLLDMIEKHPLKGNIIITGYVHKEDLAPLYTGAEVFVYPSFYEGFGLPILEAMQCFCPVITSNISSLPEVLGNAGILVHPADIEGIREAIEKVLNNKKLRTAMKKCGLARSKEFSWEKSARTLHDIMIKNGK